MDRILVDECLSVALVATAKARGHDATHVVWLGKEGMQDWNLMPLIVQNDFVFVTNNRRDFLMLYAEVELHSGLVIILPSVDRDEQVRLFNRALDAAEELGDLVNKVIEVDRDGSVKVSNWVKGKSAQ
jgi:predicted nuclease of predicted toxin-antitoxin system